MAQPTVRTTSAHHCCQESLRDRMRMDMTAVVRILSCASTWCRSRRYPQALDYIHTYGERETEVLGGGTQREKRKLRQHLIHGRLQVGDSNEEEVVLQKIEERRHQQQQTFPGLTYVCVYIDICNLIGTVSLHSQGGSRSPPQTQGWSPALVKDLSCG